MRFWLYDVMRGAVIGLAGATLLVPRPVAGQAPLRVVSPDGRNEVTVALSDGALHYALMRDGRAVVQPSRLGFEFRDAPRQPEQPRIRTTLAKQLALYVVLYSPLHMAADLPESYEGQPAFQFIKDVAVDWAETRVLEGKIGDYVVVARRERDGPDWYIGAITDEEARSFEVPLWFLPSGQRYVAEIYADAPGAHWLSNPLAVESSSRPVDARSRLTLNLAAGGGQAIRIRPAR